MHFSVGTCFELRRFKSFQSTIVIVRKNILRRILFNFCFRFLNRPNQQNMMDQKGLILSIIAISLTILIFSPETQACSCYPSHPQTSYCNSEYGNLIRISTFVWVLSNNSLKIFSYCRENFEEIKSTHQQPSHLQDWYSEDV